MSAPKNRHRNILQIMREREISGHIRYKYAINDSIYNKYICNLAVKTELKGHKEPVSCIQWNENGSTLASAHIDGKVILWDPYLQNIKTTIKTSLSNRIFTLKFLPKFNNDIVVFGTFDWGLYTYNITTGNNLNECYCSIGYVNQVAVANDMPSVYWSASEDGLIRQYDMRMSHDCEFNDTKINLISMPGPAKCLAINQRRSEQLAIGINDPYIRLYDRRMIKSSYTVKCPFPNNSSKKVFKVDDNNTPTKNTNKSSYNIIQYFVPGHLNLKESEVTSKQKYIKVTCVAFSPDGQELLANYGNEYVYLYNILNQAENAFCNIPKILKAPRENGEGSSNDTIAHVKLPNKVEELNSKGNIFYKRKDYTTAINIYSEAIDIFECSKLFSNRARAYIKRKWFGDIYAALRDCVTALKLDPNCMRADFYLAVCLYEFRMYKDSKIYLEQYSVKYPSKKTEAKYKKLYNEILNKKQITTGFEGATMSNIVKYYSGLTKDYQKRFYGHGNVSSNFLEANYFGNNFIVGGSDDGFIFIWDKRTEKNMVILKGDREFIQCVQPHPSEFILATSGSNNGTKLWTPLPEDLQNLYEVTDKETIAKKNQRRMKIGMYDSHPGWRIENEDLTT